MVGKFYDQIIHGIDMNPEIRDINLGAPKFNVKLETDGAHTTQYCGHKIDYRYIALRKTVANIGMFVLHKYNLNPKRRMNKAKAIKLVGKEFYILFVTCTCYTLIYYFRVFSL